MSGLKNYVVGLLFVSMLLSGQVVFAAWSGIELPAVTGKYGIGTIEYPMTDTSRGASVLEKAPTSPYRQIMTKIWYPTDLGESGKHDIYVDKLTAELYLGSSNLPGGAEANSLKIKNHALVQVLPVQGAKRFPVLVFSPGLQMTYYVYQSIIEDLVSHGYVVIGVNSPESAGITVFPDGHYDVFPQLTTDEERLAYCNNNIATVSKDLEFVVQQIPVLNKDTGFLLQGKMNTTEVGTLGHSFGGAAAVQAALHTSNIKAAADFDGSMWGDDYKQKIKQPILLLDSKETYETDPSLKILRKMMANGSYEVVVDKADHSDFSDMMLLQGSLTDNGVEVETAKEKIALTRYAVRSFFDGIFGRDKTDGLEKMENKFVDVKVYKK